MRLPVQCALLVICLVRVSGQTTEANPKPRGNFIDVIALPEAQRDVSSKEVVATLAAGMVKTVSAARFWAFPGAGFLRGDELPYVTGLFYVEVSSSDPPTQSRE